MTEPNHNQKHLPEAKGPAQPSADEPIIDKAVVPVALFTEDDAPIPAKRLSAKEQALNQLRQRAMAEQTEIPRPTGIIASIDLIPVCNGSVTGSL